jgi:Arm domain-containing DNA-binding protein
MTRTFAILFSLKTRTGRPKDKPSDIYVRVTTNGVSRDISVQRKCLPELWDQTTGRAAGRTGNAKTLNSFLDTGEAKVKPYHPNCFSGCFLNFELYSYFLFYNVFISFQGSTVIPLLRF